MSFLLLSVCKQKFDDGLPRGCRKTPIQSLRVAENTGHRKVFLFWTQSKPPPLPEPQTIHLESEGMTPDI